ncbi:protein phosphatase 1 regulatory subunit 12A isoform X1 [Carassius gibelio]|uniref:protein phosphatase 1 regulatory subunit 12A isoform X1 n=1 Tax=Carassius gibelio TaxID=101364 RepID=UPI0022793FC2|nr:protein phosphatase 1 regulatory subunit 12A isoform X1 [Carassius gibelio]XP_052400306.1 protein phosphatase 1 regulatory subunit 12A isoform X1 [Carassius gibelio]XP_052400307.1 protein phosphatase 1 regulatory subunit 12A isoform X1 [Carassius gibelio]
MAGTDRSRSEAAKQRRQDQLQRWRSSETERTGAEARSQGPAPGNRRARVRFAQGAVFMAACSAGDREEVAELLRQGADINHANIDGLTALHQACIDENAEMVQFLVESGSDVNRGDNEGWRPLHAAASCGFIQIAKYLIEHCAHVGAVNSEGELPLDVATEDAMGRLLKAEIKKQGIDVDQARREEERVMLQDAMAVLAGSGSLVPHPNTQATALHVAAAKGYIEVLKVLLKCGIDVDSRDSDGWTAFHAAAHWGQEEACVLLAEHMCDMNAVNNVGQTPLDVADENIVDNLEELQKKQNAMRLEKQKIQTPVIETSPPVSTALSRPRRTSISRMSSREKITLHEREKLAPPTLQTPPTEEDEEESARTAGQSKPSSSSSSEEDSESESDAESEKAKTREMINNLNNKRNAASSVSSVSSTALNQVKQAEPVRTPVTEAPGSWRTSLRKAGSSVTLGSAVTSDPASEALKDPETKLGMSRSASSPRLSSESDNKNDVICVQEPRLARVQPTPSRRLFSISDTSTNPELSSSLLSRSSSYTRRLNSQSSGEVSAPNPSLPRSSSYGRKLDDPSVTSVTTATSGLSRLNNLIAQRLAQEEAEKKEPVPNSVTTSTSGEPETKQRRKSYLTPVRDEEAEAQRKARSRHARQSRRSTQGVTLTDLQEAEKTMKTENKEKEKKEEEEKEGKQKKGEEGEVSWRSRIANLQKSDLLGLTLPPGAPRPDRQDADSEERAMERRRARARRRGKTGESDDNDPSGEESSSGRDPQTDRHTSSRSDSVLNDCILTRGSESRDFKKMFEEMSRENRHLQSQLSDTQRTISLTRADLEKATQRQERFTDCTALMEMEKKEKKMLERRASELEEELKVLGDLRADNQRLKDENGALIRVISKLSK